MRGRIRKRGNLNAYFNLVVVNEHTIPFLPGLLRADEYVAPIIVLERVNHINKPLLECGQGMKARTCVQARATVTPVESLPFFTSIEPGFEGSIDSGWKLSEQEDGGLSSRTSTSCIISQPKTFLTSERKVVDVGNNLLRWGPALPRSQRAFE